MYWLEVVALILRMTVRAFLEWVIGLFMYGAAALR